MLQKIFKSSYSDVLKAIVNPSAYRVDRFDYDENEVGSIAFIQQPEGLSERMVPGNDLESAITLYEAYKGLTPIIASNEAFWSYLSHVDLFDYMKRCYPDIPDGEEGVSFIVKRWFNDKEHGLMGTPLPRLWWSVCCTVDERRSDSYELTRVLFNLKVTNRNRIQVSTLFRLKEATAGILEFIKDNPSVFEVHEHSRVEYIMKLFNNMGAYKRLVYMDRSFFYDELVSRRDSIMQIASLREVKSGEAFNVDLGNDAGEDV